MKDDNFNPFISATWDKEAELYAPIPCDCGCGQPSNPLSANWDDLPIEWPYPGGNGRRKTYRRGCVDLVPKPVKDPFLDHLEKASAIVGAWPAWKQEVLGGNAAENLTSDPDVSILYHDLLLSVANVYPGETRHQTAKRIIVENQKGTDDVGCKENVHGDFRPT